MSAIEVRSAGVCVSESGVLLVNHSKHGRSYWVLPGGHVEFGERLDAALVREMREELQLDVTVGPLVLVHDFITETRHVVSLVFRVEPEGDAFSVTPGRVLRGARWVPLDELDDVDLLPPIADPLRRIVAGLVVQPVYIGPV